MLGKIRTVSCIYLAIIPLFILTFWQLKNSRFTLSLQSHLEDHPKYRPGWYSLSKEQFVATAVDTSINDSFDDTSIRLLCDVQIWDPSVVFTCHGVIGGIGKRH